MSKQKIWTTIGVVFLCVLLSATIYSRTVYQWSLPKVEPATPRNIQSLCTVPAGAIYEDANGNTFILLVQERRGAWGKEYVCVKQYVSVSESTNTNVVLNGIDALKYPVVTGSDKPVSDGSVVRFY